jgi:excisionase family DNA binding protein
MEREALNVKETAASLGASVASVWKWIREGELPSVKIGGRVFVPRHALRRRLEQVRDEDELTKPGSHHADHPQTTTRE